MKKFNLPLTTAISAAILAAVSAGCNRNSERDWEASTDTRVCVDKSGNRVAEDRCQSQSYSSSHIGVAPFVWYYIARGGYIPWMGRPVGGGSYSPMSSAGGYASAPASAPAGAVTRGGFGGIGSGHSVGA